MRAFVDEIPSDQVLWDPRMDTTLDTTRTPQPIGSPFTPEGAVSTADLAECTCPDFCERDHDND